MTRHEITTIETPPQWWLELYAPRQATIRAGIRSILRMPEYPRIDVETVRGTTDRWERREIEAAFEALCADGVLARNGDRFTLRARNLTGER